MYVITCEYLRTESNSYHLTDEFKTVTVIRILLVGQGLLFSVDSFAVTLTAGF